MQNIYNNRQTEEPMKDEMGWEEREQERENMGGETDEIEAGTEREERDSKTFPDFGRMRGKSGKANPLINKKLLHMELDLLQGVVFLIYLLFFLSYVVGIGVGARKSITSFLFLTNWKLKRTSPKSYL